MVSKRSPGITPGEIGDRLAEPAPEFGRHAGDGRKQNKDGSRPGVRSAQAAEPTSHRGSFESMLLISSGLYLVANGIGLAIALDDNLSSKPFGLSTGLDPEIDFFVIGTALCAPFGLLLLLAVLVRLSFRSDHSGTMALRGLILCGTAFISGMLVEPITYDVLSPGGFEWDKALVIIANLVLPLLIVAASTREVTRRRRTD
jgi:hypothetical protein